MSLNVIGSYFKNKSIKLSDSFIVQIQIKPNQTFNEYYSCTGFTLPKVEYQEEVQFYGNVSQTFLIPNYDSCKELTLDFYEIFGDNNSATKELFFENNKSYNLEQKILDTVVTVNKGEYINRYINGINIKILDNNLKYSVSTYKFNKLRISNYTLYGLDYTQEAPCKISITFNFESMEII